MNFIRFSRWTLFETVDLFLGSFKNLSELIKFDARPSPTAEDASISKHCFSPSLEIG